jgi:diacylglycerol kinase family enzyme
VDGRATKATFAVVSHVRRYAGDWIIAPEASLAADEVDVLLFSGRSRWRLYSLFRHIRLGKSGHLTRGFGKTVRGRCATIRSLEDYPHRGSTWTETASCRRRSCAGPRSSTVSIVVPR